MRRVFAFRFVAILVSGFFFRSAWATLAHLSPMPGVLSVLPYANVFEPLFVGVAFAFTFEFVCF